MDIPSISLTSISTLSFINENGMGGSSGGTRTVLLKSIPARDIRGGVPGKR